MILKLKKKEVKILAYCQHISIFGYAICVLISSLQPRWHALQDDIEAKILDGRLLIYISILILAAVVCLYTIVPVLQSRPYYGHVSVQQY